MKIRLWKLGSLEHNVYPTKESINNLKTKLVEIKASEEDIFDLIWGPEVSLEIIDIDCSVEDYVVDESGKLVKI